MEQVPLMHRPLLPHLKLETTQPDLTSDHHEEEDLIYQL